MRHTKVILSAVLLLVSGLTELQAQEAVIASGGNATGTGGSVSYSVGQVVYTTTTGTNGSSGQGVQQPFEISTVTGIEEAKGINLICSAYPNPATDFIKLIIEDYEVQHIRYQIYNIKGSLLLSNKVEANETNISIQSLLPAIYFLKVTDRDKLIKTFKIIKK